MALSRTRFTGSSAGGRALSAIQLPFFLAHPPANFGVLSTTGRKTGKRRRRCIRAVRSGDRVYMVAIKGVATTGWAKNALAAAEVRLRLPGGSVSGCAREVNEAEAPEALATYANTVHWFDYLMCVYWLNGRPTRLPALAIRFDRCVRHTPPPARQSL